MSVPARSGILPTVRSRRGTAALAAAGLLMSGLPGSAAPSTATPSAAAVSFARCESSQAAVVESFVSEWRVLRDSRDSLSTPVFERRLDALIEKTLDLPAIAARVLPGVWERLSPAERTRFTGALVESFRKGLLEFAAERGGALGLEGTEGSGAGNSYLVRFGGGEAAPLSLALGESKGDCRVIDVRAGGRGLVATYRERALALVGEYSLAYAIARLADRPYVVLEDFADTPVGDLPAGWGWKDKDDEKRKPYRVREENGNPYLEATDEGESVILGKEVPWNLNEYPYISFRVRVHEIPEGGDERYDETVDSAAGIYVTYRRKALGLIPESVKYVWSSTLPVGSAAIREGVGKPWQIVFATGEEGIGEWHTYVFDLRDAYRRTFGGDPPDRPVGIGILSDANSTHSRAFADYDDIVALRDAGEGVTGGVKEIVTRRRRRRG